MLTKINKNLISIIAILIVLLTIATIFLVGKKSVAEFTDEAQYQTSQVEQDIQTSVNFVNYVSYVAHDHFEEDPQGVDVLYNEFEYNSSNDTYYLDLDETDENISDVSFISGAGQIPVTEEVVSELNLAFKFNEYFESFYTSTENVSSVYYLSENNFLSIYPYQNSEMTTYSEDLYDKEWYKDATPENNPERKPVWTSIYVDAFGKGLIITLSMPIYDGDEFKGVVAVDCSVNGIEAMFETEQDQDTFLYDSNGNIIASNTDLTVNSNDIHTIEELGTDINNTLDSLDTKSEEVEFVNGDFVFAVSIENTDWTFASVLPASELLLNSLLVSLPIIFILVVVIFLLFNSKKNQEKNILEAQNEVLEDKIKERTRELELSQEATIDSVTTLTEFRDKDTGYHILRTKHFAKILAEALGKRKKYQKLITPELVNKIYMSAPLHDIGKVGVKDEILMKPGKLTEEERLEMQKHTTIGYEALLKSKGKFGSSSFIDCALDMTKYHHENWDGSGYPDGLSGEEIPLSARIMAVADVYDALTNERVYKSAMSHETAVWIINSESEVCFDPEVVAAFMNVSDEFAKIGEQFKDDETPETE